MYLGTRVKQGAPDPGNPLGAGFYGVVFQPADFQIRARFKITYISITGPAGSTMRVFRDNTFRGATVRGDLNEWDPAQPMFVMPGQAVSFYWSTGTGTIPIVTLECHTDDVL